jgi:hypothetical protein
MNSGIISYLKITAAAAIVGIIGWVLVSEFRSLSRHDDSKTRVWFYDESEKALYPMPVNTVPPDKGIGGPSGDGMRAIVVGFTGYRHDRSQRKIAYLQKYSAELKQALDEVITARAAGRIFAGPVPSRQSEYFQSNTLVKRPDDSEWHPANTKEGQRIMNEWRSWQGADGSRPVICAVD